jgi:hypothetical protein
MTPSHQLRTSMPVESQRIARRQVAAVGDHGQRQ